MYKGQLFNMEGETISVSEPVDCLINACMLFESLYYFYPDSLYQISNREDKFLLDTVSFIESIPVEKFAEKAKSLEAEAKEIILRVLERIFMKYPEESSTLSQYSRHLLV